MAIPAGATRMSLVGHLASGEIFDTSMWWTGTGIASAADANAAAVVFANAFGANEGPFTDILSADSGYDEVRVYAYPAGGPRASYIGSAPIAGGIGDGIGTAPLQIAMCVSLLTGHAGRSYRGRMYLPCDGTTFANHQFGSAVINNTVDALASFMAAVVLVQTDWVPVVVSTALSAAHPIVGLRCDSRPDVQRRRANRQGSLYVAVASFP